MSTGAMATLIGQQPNSFTGLKTIGKIYFILDILLFLAFCGCIGFRFARNYRAINRSLHHPHESFYFGAFWVSIALILYGTQQYGVPACGPWLVKALEVCFWMYAGCVLLVAVFQYHVIFDREKLPVVDAVPAWIMPVYPFIVLGPLAAVLEYSQPKEAALPIILGGLCFQGLGWMIALIMYTIYVTRLVNSDFPEPSKKPGMYVAVGPSAYTAATFVALGMQAPKVLPEHFLGTTSIITGEVWKAIGVPIGIFIWLLAFWFCALSTVSILTTAKHMHFTLDWWSFIFPNAGLTIALIQIGTALDSDGIKAVTSAMTIILVVLWFFVAFENVKGVWRGDLLWPGMDEDLEDVEGVGHDEESEEEERVEQEQQRNGHV
ncbi:voltage-dependent anion channel [Massariosphaeria phaeospora]|uniref:Voltage-dependent anion channel n=1 Tax=Massariosphaeria phaeospora TaxID=100035 RepID=A0A7C8MJ74_9PLEO|nr:voltage-dependent anion channel [Massariosphaeria phaeospora]